jgi:hypothetical protein
MPIRNWLGVVLFAIGAWMFTTALRRRNRARAARREARAQGLQLDIAIHQKFALAAAVARPVVYAGLLFTALGVVGFTVALGDSSLLSPVDVGGLLVLLLGYGVWFSITTRYRDVVPAALPSRTD